MRSSGFLGPFGARAGRARGPSGAGVELERGELGGSSGASRSHEKTYPDVGGGFVEPHHRGDGIDWSEEYPYKGTETTQCRPTIEIHVTPVERQARPPTCAVHGLWLCDLCARVDGGIA
jgi:hypothetical protein